MIKGWYWQLLLLFIFVQCLLAWVLFDFMTLWGNSKTISSVFAYSIFILSSVIISLSCRDKDTITGSLILLLVWMLSFSIHFYAPEELHLFVLVDVSAAILFGAYRQIALCGISAVMVGMSLINMAALISKTSHDLIINVLWVLQCSVLFGFSLRLNFGLPPNRLKVPSWIHMLFTGVAIDAELQGVRPMPREQENF